MCLTFPILTLRRFLTKNFEIFLGGTPISAPQITVSPKMSTPEPPMTPLFYCGILFYSKNGDVCKKLELNSKDLTEIWGFSVEKKNQKNFKIFDFSELQKVGILVSRIPDIFGRNSGHFQIAASYPSIFGLKSLQFCWFKAQFNLKMNKRWVKTCLCLF